MNSLHERGSRILFKLPGNNVKNTLRSLMDSFEKKKRNFFSRPHQIVFFLFFFLFKINQQSVWVKKMFISSYFFVGLLWLDVGRKWPVTMCVFYCGLSRWRPLSLSFSLQKKRMKEKKKRVEAEIYNRPQKKKKKCFRSENGHVNNLFFSCFFRVERNLEKCRLLVQESRKSSGPMTTGRWWYLIRWLCSENWCFVCSFKKKKQPNKRRNGKSEDVVCLVSVTFLVDIFHRHPGPHWPHFCWLR